MRINCINNISFQKLPMCERYGINIVDEFTYHTQEPNLSSYTVKHYNLKKDCIEFRFKNKSKIAASEEIKITPQKTIFVSAMYTDPEMQHKYGFGKSMHLLNIIEMLENNAESIDLSSAASAIPFHTSIGFYPDNNWSDGLSVNIQLISNDNTPELSKYAKIAKSLLNAHNMSENALSILGNKLLYQYTKEALKIKPKDDLKYLFSQHATMTLKRNDVLKNKDFYNKLFDKYAIDYHID